MKLDKKQIIETVSIAALVVSLLFVGMQLLLDRRVAIADQYFNRAEAVRADYRSRMESEIYFLIQEERWKRGARPGWWSEDVAFEIEPLINNGDMTIREFAYNELRAHIGIIGYDNLYFQFKQGLLTDEDWNYNRQRLMAVLRVDPFIRAVISNEPRGLNEVLQELIDE